MNPSLLIDLICAIGNVLGMAMVYLSQRKKA